MHTQVTTKIAVTLSLIVLKVRAVRAAKIKSTKNRSVYKLSKLI